MSGHKDIGRIRALAGMREIASETTLKASDLVYPVFVEEGLRTPVAIEPMPGQYRQSVESVLEVSRKCLALGIKAVLLFGVPLVKDSAATSAFDDRGVVQEAVRLVKKHCPELVVMTDVCACAYTDHGHCGILSGDHLDKEATLALLAQIAVSHARAGADVVAPSAMADGQVGALRGALTEARFEQTLVMEYSAKFASAYYGPFRVAAGSAPAKGDRASYQIAPPNIRQARREVLADVQEGADIVMVKPGLAYLDVVRMAREVTDLPLAVYNVGGEYAMLKAAAEKGWIDEKSAVLENLIGFKRAGADIVITYHAMEAASWLAHV